MSHPDDLEDGMTIADRTSAGDAAAIEAEERALDREAAAEHRRHAGMDLPREEQLALIRKAAALAPRRRARPRA